jgi:Uma2 family endonuclease
MVDYSAERDNQRYEILDGKIVMMARPRVPHNFISGNIYKIFANFLNGKKCVPFGDGTDVILKEKKDSVVPDFFIVCNKNIIKNSGVFGVPDLIVEILSPGSVKSDRGYKKNLYEKYGVKEYWIVNPIDYTAEVYLLKNGKYELDNVYRKYREEDLECLDEKEQSEIITEFKTSLYDDLIIQVEDVFYNPLEN